MTENKIQNTEISLNKQYFRLDKHEFGKSLIKYFDTKIDIIHHEKLNNV